MRGRRLANVKPQDGAVLTTRGNPHARSGSGGPILGFSRNFSVMKKHPAADKSVRAYRNEQGRTKMRRQKAHRLRRRTVDGARERRVMNSKCAASAQPVVSLSIPRLFIL